MKYFKSIKSFEDLKSQFKKLALQYHPDRPGGNEEIMKIINNEYDELFPVWKGRAAARGQKIEEKETAQSTRTQFYTEYGWAGEKYNNNLSTKDIAKILRSYVKERFSDCKFSITISTYSGGSSIRVVLKEAPYPVFTAGTEAEKEGYAQINHNTYYLEGDDRITDYAKHILKEVISEINAYRYDDSDSMIDYFSTNFYYSICIGDWDKPFKVVVKQPKISANKKNTTLKKAI